MTTANATAPGLLTIDDLASRWQVSIERTWRRVRHAAGLKAINLGTAKHPELRFRLASVEEWERQVEGPTPAFLDPTEEAEAEAAPIKVSDQAGKELGEFRPRNRARTG